MSRRPVPRTSIAPSIAQDTRLPVRGARSARPSAVAFSSTPPRSSGARRSGSRASKRSTAASRCASSPVDVETTAAYFEYYAGMADKLQGDTIPLGPDYISFTLHEPVGVTAHIIPWNFPLVTTARGVAPALAAGNTAVVKPAEQTPAHRAHARRPPGGGGAAARRLQCRDGDTGPKRAHRSARIRTWRMSPSRARSRPARR